MIVYTTNGSEISLESTNKRSLTDRNGVEWVRYPEEDTWDPFGCAYRETRCNVSVIKLSRSELKRTLAGTSAMQTPTTVTEMRYYALHLSANHQTIINGWPDQKLREVLIEADENSTNPGTLLEKKVNAIIYAEERAKEEECKETQREATEGTSVAQKTRRAPKSTPRSRKQEGSVSVALEGGSVMLTPKQLEFMERLSECPGWDGNPTGEYNASEYAQELSDTMNPMSVGAVLTTLREKGLMTTEKKRVGAISCCYFRLTDIGTKVYKELAGGMRNA